MKFQNYLDEGKKFTGVVVKGGHGYCLKCAVDLDRADEPEASDLVTYCDNCGKETKPFGTRKWNKWKKENWRNY